MAYKEDTAIITPVGIASGGTNTTVFTPYAVVLGPKADNTSLQDVGAVGTSGQVLTSNGAGTIPTWQTSGATAVTSWLGFPQSVVTAFSSLQLAVNTTQYLARIYLPFQITVNSITIDIVTKTTDGTLDLTIYSENGQTQLIAVTTATITTTGHVTTSVSSVVLNPGIYYFSANTNSTTDVNVRSLAATNVTLVNAVSGEPVFSGTLTITAGIPATTFDPTALTAVANVPALRLDN